MELNTRGMETYNCTKKHILNGVDKEFFNTFS
jgi:hypothetical protein